MHRTYVCSVPAQGPTLSELGTVRKCAKHCPECFRSGLFFDPENAFGRFIAEEAAASGAKCVLTHSPTWIIDPIDGTCNFVHRFPTVAVSIGFAVRQELEFGVIYHCTEERLYTGRRGRGAFCNGQRLRVSGETGGPLDLMACRVVAASTREMAMLIAQALQTINYGRDDEK
ncbi:hypothetical protein H8959_002099 [Pygathrix nigripes]